MNNELTEIPASWVADYMEPEYDVFLANMEEDDQEAALEAEHLDFLRAYYYKGVMQMLVGTKIVIAIMVAVLCLFIFIYYYYDDF